MKVDEYENFIDRFQDKIKDSIFPEQYNDVKKFITSIVRSLDYGSKINRDNFNKLIRYGMYHTLTTYYLYDLKRPEVVNEITSSIIAKDKALDIKNKKVEEPKKEIDWENIAIGGIIIVAMCFVVYLYYNTKIRR